MIFFLQFSTREGKNLAVKELHAAGATIAATPSNPKNIWARMPRVLTSLNDGYSFINQALTDYAKHDWNGVNPAGTQDESWYTWSDEKHALPAPPEIELDKTQALRRYVFVSVSPEQTLTKGDQLLYPIDRECTRWRVGLFEKWHNARMLQLWIPEEVVWEDRPFVFTRVILGYRITN